MRHIFKANFNASSQFPTHSSHLQALLQDFLSLGSTDRAMDCNLFISTDTKGSHSVAGWWETYRINAWHNFTNSYKCHSTFIRCNNVRDGKSHLPLEKTGVWPVSCSSTLAARVSLSPLSPTQMFRHSLRMRSSLIGFSFFSLWSCNVTVK